MITEQKLNIYIKYGGYNDLWLRMGSNEERNLLKIEDWMIIYKCIDDVCLELNGKLSYDEITNNNEFIFQNSINSNVAIKLKEIARAKALESKKKTGLIERFIDWIFPLPNAPSN